MKLQHAPRTRGRQVDGGAVRWLVGICWGRTTDPDPLVHHFRATHPVGVWQLALFRPSAESIHGLHVAKMPVVSRSASVGGEHQSMRQQVALPRAESRKRPGHTKTIELACQFGRRELIKPAQIIAEAPQRARRVQLEGHTHDPGSLRIAVRR